MGLVLGVSHALPHWWQDPSTPQFQCFLIFMRTPFDSELPILTLYHIQREGLFLEVSHASTPMGAGPQQSQILGFLSMYAHTHTLCLRTIKFDMVPHVGRGLVLEGHPRFVPKGRSPMRSPIFGVLYLYL